MEAERAEALRALQAVQKEIAAQEDRLRWVAGLRAVGGGARGRRCGVHAGIECLALLLSRSPLPAPADLRRQHPAGLIHAQGGAAGD